MKLVLTIALSLAFTTSAFAAVKCNHKFGGGLNAVTTSAAVKSAQGSVGSTGSVSK